MSGKKEWIYQIRGLAIIAVVVCHQQGILHDSEFIQLLTLYSVTTLVFLMGVTKAISLKRHYTSHAHPEGMVKYSLRAMTPVLCSYLIASFAYLSIDSGKKWVTGLSYNTVLENLLDFSASSEFYFIRYYILFSLYAPFLYAIIKYIIYKKELKKYRTLLEAGVFLLVWIVGYESIGRVEVFGASYLFVYSVGLLAGQIDIPVNKKYLIPAFVLLTVGFVSVKRFYWARVDGVYDYSGGVNVLASKLQLNPPNISVILYSFGVIAVTYLLFEMCNDSKVYIIKAIGRMFGILGKYSMDIFLWHILIQECLNRYFLGMEKNVLKWIIYYGAMFMLPVIGRSIYNKIKEKTYEVLIQ